jgi:hypothetical protein
MLAIIIISIFVSDTDAVLQVLIIHSGHQLK